MIRAALAAAISVVTLQCNYAADPSEKQQGVEFFEKKIRPVLVQHCYKCHSVTSKNVRGGLLLDTRAGMRRGGESGAAVIPRKPEASVLIDAIRYEGFEMPPKQRLPKSVIADFMKWIRMGAPDPREGGEVSNSAGIDFEKGRQFWSFQPIRDPKVPSVKDAAWPRTEIDRFIRSRQEAQRVNPTGDATRRVLIRRAYFDLIGLPPSAEEISRFLEDKSPDAFEDLIDRLLASRHFGERWGRHWLDVVRFAESSGGGRTRIFDNAWRFRDYVIKSFNQDKPFDEFVAEQIAGDLLPHESVEQARDQLTATGFLVLAPTNYELQDKELLDMEVIDEQLDTLGKAFLGMTIGCARCHDHKFDPIPTTDYYAMAGIFKSTRTLIHANVSNFVQRPLAVSAERQQLLTAYKQKADPLKARIGEIKNQLQVANGKSQTRVAKVDSLPGLIIDDWQAELKGAWSRSSSIKQYVGDGYRYAGAGKSSARFATNKLKPGRYEVRLAYSANPNRSSKVTTTIEHAKGTATKVVSHRRQPALGRLFVSLGQYEFSANGPAAVTILCRGADGVVIADAVQFLPASAADKLPRVAPGNSKVNQAALQTELKRLEADLKELGKHAPPSPPIVMSVEENDKPADCHVCVRGSVHNQGDEIPRGFLRVVEFAGDKIQAGDSGRLELARWIGSPQNPLTARVIVNRVWHHLFGAGLVRTVDNFGRTGELPSHPELLDYLTSRFIEDGWSTKSAIKRIMLSRTYQLSSKSSFNREPTATASVDSSTIDVKQPISIDLENRLLWKMNRRRLDAEAIRDAILTLSGQLDLTQGGSTIQKDAKSEFGYKIRSNRRSVYVPVFRNTLHELFEVFDFADPNLAIGRRSTSTLPTQALYMMNSPFSLEHSRHAARLLLKEKGLSDTMRIQTVYVNSLGRRPSSAEQDLALKFIDQYIANNDDKADATEIEAWGQFYQAIFASIDFRYVE